MRRRRSSAGTAIAIKVADASALIAIIFDEPERESVTERLEYATLIAPSLVWFEIANAGLSKIRRQPDRRDDFFEAFALARDSEIEILEVDHRAVLDLAESTGLTVYDASYLWLALERDAELVTLDRELNAAFERLRAG